MTPKNILLVEDDGVQQIIMERHIAKLGHNLMATVSEGRTAIEAALSLKGIDLIIMDIRLSDNVDGIDAMQEIRKNSSVKVIYVTGNTEASTRQRAEGTDFEAFIEKPVTYEKIRNAIQQALAEN